MGKEKSLEQYTTSQHDSRGKDFPSKTPLPLLEQLTQNRASSTLARHFIFSQRLFIPHATSDPSLTGIRPVRHPYTSAPQYSFQQ